MVHQSHRLKSLNSKHRQESKAIVWTFQTTRQKQKSTQIIFFGP